MDEECAKLILGVNQLLPFGSAYDLRLGEKTWPVSTAIKKSPRSVLNPSAGTIHWSGIPPIQTIADRVDDL